MADLNKKLKLQIGICKRLVKEVASYEKEVVKQEAKIQTMREEGRDPYDIRKQEEVLQESYMMVPDSKTRLESAVLELSSIVDNVKESDPVDAALLTEAKDIIQANQ